MGREGGIDEMIEERMSCEPGPCLTSAVFAKHARWSLSNQPSKLISCWRWSFEIL